MSFRQRAGAAGDIVALADLTQRDIGAWRELADNALEPNPFFDPDFVLPAARGLGELPHIGLARIAGPDGWLACLPLRKQRRWYGLPFSCLATWRHRYCLLGTPLIARGEEATTASHLLEVLRGPSGNRAGAGLDWFAGGGGFAQALGDPSMGSTVELNSFDRAFVHRRASDDYMAGSVKGKHRREFRRLAGALETELGGHLEVVQRTAEPDAIERFLELEAAGWKGEAGTALASVASHAEFFREMAHLLGDRQRAELTFLEAGGTVAAARFSLRAGGVLFCFKVAYDERLRRFSPGREIELRQLGLFHDDPDLVAMDSCTAADNELFNRLWPDRRRIVTSWVKGRGPRGRAIASALALAASRRARR